jgi:hypothetical protein
MVHSCQKETGRRVPGPGAAGGSAKRDVTAPSNAKPLTPCDVRVRPLFRSVPLPTCQNPGRLPISNALPGWNIEEASCALKFNSRARLRLARPAALHA